MTMFKDRFAFDAEEIAAALAAKPVAKGFSLAGLLEHIGAFALDIVENQAAEHIFPQLLGMGKADGFVARLTETRKAAGCPDCAKDFKDAYLGYHAGVDIPGQALRGAHVFGFPTGQARDHFIAQMGNTGVDHAMRAVLRKFDPNQPRDEKGMWTSGNGGTDEQKQWAALYEGGGAMDPTGDLGNATMDDVVTSHYGNSSDAQKPITGYTFQSPNLAEKDLTTAEGDLYGERHSMFDKMAREVDGRLGLTGQQSDVIGAWSDGAENATMLESPDANMQALRTSAAMKGWLGNQKAVLAFKADPEGKAALYDATVDGPGTQLAGGAGMTLRQTHQALLDAGVPFHTLSSLDGNKTRILVVDTDGSLGPAVAKFADAHNVNWERTYGQAEFVGDGEGTGSDAEQRARARTAYEGVIASHPDTTYQGRTVEQVWRGLRDRWAAPLEAVKRALSFAEALDAMQLYDAVN